MQDTSDVVVVVTTPELTPDVSLLSPVVSTPIRARTLPMTLATPMMKPATRVPSRVATVPGKAVTTSRLSRRWSLDRLRPLLRCYAEPGAEPPSTALPAPGHH